MKEHSTAVIKIDPVHPEPQLIEQAAALLRAGEIVVFPTETVYGLGADAFQVRALEKIFVAKDRPHSDPLIVHIADKGAVSELTTALLAVATRLIAEFWPGPLTLILPRGARVPSLVTAGLDTVGVRMPRHPVALALIRALGSPIAAPSANRFMHISPTTAQHVLSDLNGRVPLILDSGPCVVGVESTVLDLCAVIPTVLRPGGVSLEALRTVLPQVSYTHHSASLNLKAEAQSQPHAQYVAQKAPGQLLTHYAPTIPLLLFDGSSEIMRAAMLEETSRRRARGETVGVLLADEDAPAFADSGALLHSVGSAAQPDQVAAALFAGLRALEATGVQIILCRSFDERGLGLAVRDRLLRAAGGRVYQHSP